MTTVRSAATRTRLVDVALNLFESQGYDETTVEQIAAAAGVSHMTFFRHFPTKDAVLLDDPFDPVIAHAVADQPRTYGPMQRVAAGLTAALADIDPGTDSTVRRRVAIAARVPSLRAGMFENNKATGDAIAAALVADGSDEFAARAAAAACLAAVATALLWWAQNESDATLGDIVGSALAVVGPRP